MTKKFQGLGSSEGGKTDSVVERRTMQFIVERSCSDSIADTASHLLPFWVWVYSDPEPCQDSRWTCGADVLYRVVPSSYAERALELGRGDLAPENRFVCGHMGHLIE